MAKTTSGAEPTPSERISQEIEALDDWQGEILARLRRLVFEADPDIEEAWKWGSAVWVHNGNVCSAGIFKQHVKLNFFHGAALEDPKGLFNAGLEAKKSRGVDIHEGDKLDSAGLKALIRAAVAHNQSSG